MEWRLLATVFVTVFLAELGDKTQLATMLFAADDRASKWTVFVGASLALVACSALGVLAGSFIGNHIDERYLHYLAGFGFIVIGGYTIYAA